MKKFKDYQTNQIALPMNLITLIPDNHLVKIINKVVNKINLDSIIDRYKGRGTTAYNPRMLIKVLVYAYSLGILSRRVIEERMYTLCGWQVLTNQILELLTDLEVKD